MDPFETHCAIDPQGNYFVYLCERWGTLNENERIATLVHEAAHHSGPGDITYNPDTMRILVQSQQLDNAANFEYFARDVAQAAWGCADDEDVSDLPFSCTPGPCTCRAFQTMCNDFDWGAQIRERCPASCGECKAPTEGHT